MDSRLALLGLSVLMTPLLIQCGARTPLEVLAETPDASSAAGGSGGTGPGGSGGSGLGGSGGTVQCLEDGKECVSVGQCCHACIAGRCAIASLCQTGQAPTTMASSVVFDWTSLSVDGEHVYYHGPTGLKRIGKVGGTSQDVVSDGVVQPIATFALSATYVFAARPTGGLGINRIAKADLASTTLLQAPAADLLRWADGWLYDARQEGESIRLSRMREDGSSRETLAVVAGLQAQFFYVDAKALYYGNPSGGLIRQEFKGPPLELVPAEETVQPLGLEGGYFYYANGSIAKRIPVTGGVSQGITSDWAWFATIDGGTLYYSDGTYVKKAPKSGGPTTIIAKGEYDVRQVAVDEACAYWVEGGQGGVGVLKRAPR